VPDQLVRKLNPLALRENLHQVLLDFFWILVLRELQATRKTLHMGIDDNSAWNSERGA
jgi:hypothetical protein